MSQSGKRLFAAKERYFVASNKHTGKLLQFFFTMCDKCQYVNVWAYII